jgi:hypothetical protein
MHSGVWQISFLGWLQESKSSLLLALYYFFSLIDYPNIAEDLEDAMKHKK